MDTAARLFAARGFNGTSTRQIAEAAGVTEPVIFKHFRDKHLLYGAIRGQKASDSDANGWLGELEDCRLRHDALGLLQALYHHIVDRHERDSQFLRLMVFAALEHHPLARRLQESQGKQLYTLLELFVTEEQRAGRFRPGPPGLLVRLILAPPVYHVLLRRLFRPSWPPVDAASFAAFGAQTTLAGLSIDPQGPSQRSRPSRASRPSRSSKPRH